MRPASFPPAHQLRGDLEEVRGVFVDNIEKVLDRGERISVLVDKTQELSADTFTF